MALTETQAKRLGTWVPIPEKSLTPEQRAKCMLLGGLNFWIGSGNLAWPELIDKYIVGRDLHNGIDEYVRPPEFKHKQIPGMKPMIGVNTIDEAIEMAADPEKYGGKWME